MMMPNIGSAFRLPQLGSNQGFQLGQLGLKALLGHFLPGLGRGLGTADMAGAGVATGGGNPMAANALNGPPSGSNVGVMAPGGGLVGANAMDIGRALFQAGGNGSTTGGTGGGPIGPGGNNVGKGSGDAKSLILKSFLDSFFNQRSAGQSRTSQQFQIPNLFSRRGVAREPIIGNV